MPNFIKPRIFISAVTSELATARRQVADELRKLGYDVEEMDIFGTESGDLRNVLRDKIDDCQCLIQIVGQAYGTEPPKVDSGFGAEGFPRASYTQFEFLYALKQGKKTWLIFAEDGCTRDSPLQELDLPSPPSDLDAAGYQTERQALQRRWRQHWIDENTHVFGHAHSDTELRLAIQNMSDDLRQLRRSFRRWQKMVVGLLIVITSIVTAVYIQQSDLKEDTKSVKTTTEELARSTSSGFQETQKQLQSLASQEITASTIRRHLIESAESLLETDLAAADREANYDHREQLRDQARQAHSVRLQRIADLTVQIVELQSRDDLTPEFREMTRILETESDQPVAKAIRYSEKNRSARIERVRARLIVGHQRNRAELQPDLKAAGLEAIRGRSQSARQIYESILAVEPDWREALNGYAYFLHDRSMHLANTGEMASALHDANKCRQLSEHLSAMDNATLSDRRIVIMSLQQQGNLLIRRGQTGDAEQAIDCYSRGLDLNQRLHVQYPDSIEIASDLAIANVSLGDIGILRGERKPAYEYYCRSLEIWKQFDEQSPNNIAFMRGLRVPHSRLGDYFAGPGPGRDTEQAFLHFQRSLELTEFLLEQDPDSDQSARDVSVSLNKVADLLMARRQPGDTDAAFQYYGRSLEIRDRLLRENPESARAIRDASVVLANLADYYVRHGQPDDSEKALRYYQRSLELAERLQTQLAMSRSA